MTVQRGHMTGLPPWLLLGTPDTGAYAQGSEWGRSSYVCVSWAAVA